MKHQIAIFFFLKGKKAYLRYDKEIGESTEKNMIKESKLSLFLI